MTNIKYNIEEIAGSGNAGYRRSKSGEGVYEIKDTIPIGTMKGLISIAVPEKIADCTITFKIEPKKMWWQQKK